MIKTDTAKAKKDTAKAKKDTANEQAITTAIARHYLARHGISVATRVKVAELKRELLKSPKSSLKDELHALEQSAKRDYEEAIASINSSLASLPFRRVRALPRAPDRPRQRAPKIVPMWGGALPYLDDDYEDGWNPPIDVPGQVPMAFRGHSKGYFRPSGVHTDVRPTAGDPMLGWSASDDYPQTLKNSGQGTRNGSLELGWRKMITTDGWYELDADLFRQFPFEVSGTFRVNGDFWDFGSDFDAAVRVTLTVVISLDSDNLVLPMTLVDEDDATKSRDRTSSFGLDPNRHFLPPDFTIGFQATRGQMLSYVVRLDAHTWANENGSVKVDVDKLKLSWVYNASAVVMLTLTA